MTDTITRPTETLSPYLPGTLIQYAWDSTSLGLLKTCPRMYQYTMLEGWSPREESIHLRFGIEYHKALEGYDRQVALGADHNTAQHLMVESALQRMYEWDPDTDSKAGKYKNPTSLIRLAVWYTEHFKDDPAQTLILKDGTPAVELSFRFELDWGPAAQPLLNGEIGPALSVRQPYLLSGHLDRVVTFNDTLFVMDRKTTTTTPGQYYFAQYEPNNQMTLYSFAAKVVLDSPVKGVIIDAAQILVDDCRFVRGFTYRSTDQLEEWVVDLRRWLGQAEAYATANYWPMNDTACDKFGGCRFREVCSRQANVREAMLNAKFDKLPEEERWNPLKPR